MSQNPLFFKKEKKKKKEFELNLGNKLDQINFRYVIY